jgi:hypothetical protein
MREEQISVAICAPTRKADRRLAHTRIEKLTPIRFDQIQMPRRTN